MKLKILACVFAWLAVDYLFFTAVKKVTDNYLIYTAYWLFEVVLIGMAVFGMMQKKIGLVARLITILLLTFISKLFTGVLLLTIDIVRQFAGFESRSILITGSMIVLSLVFVLILMIVLRQLSVKIISTKKFSLNQIVKSSSFVPEGPQKNLTILF